MCFGWDNLLEKKCQKKGVIIYLNTYCKNTTKKETKKNIKKEM